MNLVEDFLSKGNSTDDINSSYSVVTSHVLSGNIIIVRIRICQRTIIIMKAYGLTNINYNLSLLNVQLFLIYFDESLPIKNNVITTVYYVLLANLSDNGIYLL